MRGSVCFLITLLCIICTAFSLDTPGAQCGALVRDYIRDHSRHLTGNRSKDNFIFFLHIPRTAGKTYASCFLRAFLPPSKRCGASYDFLRLNVSQPGCISLTSHDDYSIVDVSSHFTTTLIHSVLLKLPPLERIFWLKGL